MTLAEAIAAVEAKATAVSVEVGCVVDGRLDLGLTPRGDRYLTFVGGGIKAPGGYYPAWYLTADAAVDAWCASVCARIYWPEGRAKLWWRQRPVLISSDAWHHRFAAWDQDSGLPIPPIAWQVAARLFWGECPPAMTAQN